jgi:hypothetical protein
MAAGRHNLTRRALLGAAAGVPLAGDMYLYVSPSSSLLSPSSAGGQSTSDCPFSRALAAYRRADANLAAFRAYEAALPAAARAFPACAPLEERGNDLESSRLDAVRRLLRAPAPDLPALALKIALAIDDEIAFFSGGDTCLAAVKADAQRLCGGAANSSA